MCVTPSGKEVATPICWEKDTISSGFVQAGYSSVDSFWKRSVGKIIPSLKRHGKQPGLSISDTLKKRRAICSFPQWFSVCLKPLPVPFDVRFQAAISLGLGTTNVPKSETMYLERRHGKAMYYFMALKLPKGLGRTKREKSIETLWFAGTDFPLVPKSSTVGKRTLQFVGEINLVLPLDDGSATSTSGVSASSGARVDAAEGASRFFCIHFYVQLLLVHFRHVPRRSLAE